MPAYPLAMLLVFALTLFTSATLLFLIEPMVGKLILPMLGGTPAVWNTCMVFFQAVLLAGYAYAHATTAWLGVRKQAVLHLVIMFLPFLFFPIAVNSALIDANTDNPIPGLLLLLSVSIGVPFFVISTTAPVISRWFAETEHPSAHDPYFLYGASNLGSMLALVGYPLFVEPHFYLVTQRKWWGLGYAVLMLATAVCAVILWRSRPRLALAGTDVSDPAPPLAQAESVAFAPPSAKRRDDRVTSSPKGAVTKDKLSTLSAGSVEATALTGEVTWLRRLRWVALAAVPSSLMLGATTYITTDIAAIPLLWVPPLAIYLLSFIIVFSKTPTLVHKIHVLAMPLLVLLILFMNLSDIKPPRISYTILLQLLALYAVCMVCHGELARDRPSTGYLTEYFLWMSFGGVVGGLFNALVAPMVFNSIVEYHLAMVVACMVLPPLAGDRDTPYGFYADIGLAAAFVLTGLVLSGLRLRYGPSLDFDKLRWADVQWSLIALIVMLCLGAAAAVRAKSNLAAAWLDLALPISLGILVVGLQLGLRSEAVEPRLRTLASYIPQKIRPSLGQLRPILMFGLPAVLCYTFVERSLRFGLSVGMLLLASAVCGSLEIYDEHTLFQKRSFFGVLKVKEGGQDAEAYRTLTHGTTLHGEQFTSPERRREALTYYHRTGPIGQVMLAYGGPDPKTGKLPNIAVIGLGTGTLASYAHPGQKMTFYDIDPVVRDISFSPDGYFTFVADAKERGADVDLILGDARLTLDRNKLEPEQQYGILAVDAFSSDAIPMHLINRQALEMYLEKMRPDGVICFHISNRHLDLEPVLGNLCAELGLVGYTMSDNSESEVGKSASTWVAIARNEKDLSRLMTGDRWRHEWKAVEPELMTVAAFPDGGTGLSAIATAIGGALPKIAAPWQPVETDKAVGVWTDDYSNIWSVFTR